MTGLRFHGWFFEFAGPGLSLNLAQSIQDSGRNHFFKKRGEIWNIWNLLQEPFLGGANMLNRPVWFKIGMPLKLDTFGVNFWFETPAFHGLSNGLMRTRFTRRQF
jgi:hypothetical protein